MYGAISNVYGKYAHDSPQLVLLWSVALLVPLLNKIPSTAARAEQPTLAAGASI